MNKEMAEEILLKIVVINTMIAKQNSLIVQALTMPSLLIKNPDEKSND